MASLRKRGRVWYYRVVDADGVQREHKGCPDRRETEAMARHAETGAAHARAGLTDPKAEAFRRHEARPIADHLDKFEASTLAKGTTLKHTRLFSDRARRVVALAAGGRLDAIDPPQRSTKAQRARMAEALTDLLAGARLSILTPSGVQGALSTLKAGGRSLATCNHHRAAIRAFARWARDDGRMRDDPTSGVTGYNAKEDRRHDRRTLSLPELRNLIASADRGPVYRTMSGPSRALCYHLAVATGLRYAEIASISMASLRLSGPSPTVTVAAGYTKNGEPAVLPLPSDVAADLSRAFAGLAPDAPVFSLPEKGSDMIRVDLDAAGIPYRDAAGLVFDFHALRCQCATLADGAGVSPRVVQKLMRHSTLELTGRYTRPRALDIEGAASSLPSLRPEVLGTATMAATDGGRINDLFALHLPYAGDGSGRTVSETGDQAPTGARPSPGRNPLSESGFDATCRPLSGPVATSGVRTRTGDLRIMRPPL